MKLKHLLFALSLAGWLLLVGQSPTAVHAATLTVSSNEVAIANNGLCSLREAIINANDNAATHADCLAGVGDDTIILPAGTYTLNDATAVDEGFSVTGDLDIRSNITLSGAGSGLTILDGNDTDRVLDVVSGIVVVDDLTIQNGLSPNGANASADCTSAPCPSDSSGFTGSHGGGIYNSGNLTLNRVIITNNQTGMGGGGGNVSCSAGSCTARGGAGGAGAGIYSNGASLTIYDSVIQNNHTGVGGVGGNASCSGGSCTIFGGTGGAGAGIYGNSPNLTIGHSVTQNIDTGLGGGVATNSCRGGTTCLMSVGTNGLGAGVFGNTPLNMTFSHVTANSGGQGGGIYCTAVCTIAHSTIENNTSTLLGGGIAFVANTVQSVSHTTVANNTAGTSGGGIYVNAGTISIVNVTLSGNASNSDGAGLYANSGTTTLNHVTIAHNTADANSNNSGNGGGIFSNGGTVNLKNSVVANNIDTGGQAPDCRNTITSQLYNHIESLTGCTFAASTGDVTGSDPNLGALADNGGLTFTHLPNAGSGVLDTIPFNTNDCGNVIVVDQRGAARPFPAGGSCDKGAVEVRETISVGSCAGADLAGVQNFSFSSGNNVSLNVVTAAGLKCVSIEEMGPGVNHLGATTPLQTNNWWHIQGNISSGFAVNLTLPYANADAATRTCKWPGGLGGGGWDCGPLNGAGTTHVPNTSVTRTGLGSFSDWAVGDEAGPTAVTNLLTQTTSQPPTSILALLATLLAAFSGVRLWRRR
ncbi:MAG: hypothetical protein IPL28_24525 [Chloroflexi bacterium]|nr:hypothetical protein [Chloroflexota bacterium]